MVVPSLPGYGFSDRPAEPGMSVSKVAGLFMRLMTEGLGYDRFGAQGGDWGGVVSGWLAYEYPDNLIGIQMTMVGGSPYLGPGSRELSERERAMREGQQRWRQFDGAYLHMQGTKTQTLSYALNDSPAGLAAWIVEKYREWSDCDGDIERRYTKDELLTNITIYWATETFNTSADLYYDSQHNPWVFKQGERVDVPTSYADFPKEITRMPREWIERSYNLQRYTEMPRGGHFAAMEEPDLLVEDLRAFFPPLRW